MQPVRLYGVPFSQPVRAVMWLMLYKQTPFELVLINPGSSGETGQTGGLSVRGRTFQSANAIMPPTGGRRRRTAPRINTS